MNMHVSKKRLTSRVAPLPQPAAPTPNVILDPSKLPDQYGMICEGVCLEPEIADGACLLFDKNAPYKRGDFVILFRRPELVKPGQHQAIVKRLYMAPPPWVTFPYRDHPKSDVRALIIAEQLNPHLQFAIPCEDLLAIHKCLGLVPEGMRAKRVSETEACTMRLVKKR